MKVLITHKGLIFHEGELLKLTTPGALRKLKQELTVTYQPSIKGRIIPAQKRYLYQSINSNGQPLLVVSRNSDAEKIIYNYLLEIKTNGSARADKFITSIEYVNKVKPGEPFQCNISDDPGIILKPQQVRLVDHVFAHVYTDTRRKKGTAGCVLFVDTGKGKSYISAYSAARLGGKTAIIIPDTLQLEEWQKIFGTYYPNLRVGEYHSKLKKDGDVMLIVSNSAVTNEFKFKGGPIVPWQEYVQRFRTVIYDEIHNYPTPTLQKMFWRFGCANMMGLTATPGERADGFDIVYQKHVGPLLTLEDVADVEGSDEESEEEWKGRVRVIHYYGHPDYTKKISVSSDGMTHAGLMAQQFSRDPYRNKMIIELTRELYDQGRNVFIFAENKKYVTQMREMLTSAQALADINIEAPQFDDADVGVLKGGVSGDDKASASSSARVILITYSFGSEQLSIPKMDTIIFATSRRAKMRQITGRILRLGGDASVERYIIDIIDKETTIAKQFTDRNKVYKARGFTVMRPERKNYTDFPISA
jgi:superfamily II DNA or RNA helicase